MSARSDSLRAKPRTRQIVGFSLSPGLAGEVKKEAARRKLSLKKLFEEMWVLYQNKNEP